MKNELHLVSFDGVNSVVHPTLGKGEVVSLKIKFINKNVYYTGVVNFLGRNVQCNICFKPIEQEVENLINCTADLTPTIKLDIPSKQRVVVTIPRFNYGGNVSTI